MDEGTLNRLYRMIPGLLKINVECLSISNEIRTVIFSRLLGAELLIMSFIFISRQGFGATLNFGSKALPTILLNFAKSCI